MEVLIGPAYSAAGGVSPHRACHGEGNRGAARAVACAVTIAASSLLDIFAELLDGARQHFAVIPM